MSRESIDDGSRGCCDHGIPALVACRQCAEDEARARVKLQLAEIEEAGRKRGYAEGRDDERNDAVAWLTWVAENTRLGRVVSAALRTAVDSLLRGDHRKEKPNGKT